MDIEVKNLDVAYHNCASMHELASTKGKQLSNDLTQMIGLLIADWKGSDATLHINDLIEVETALGEVVSQALKFSSGAADCMRAVQEVRKANGASTTVGAELTDNNFEAPIIAKVEDTEQYYAAPRIESDYNDLVDFESGFKTFVSDFEDIKGKLFDMWISGANHGEAEAAFDKFSANIDTYKDYIKHARENLETAKSNISKIR